jgi:hypothetical protein
MNNNKRILTVFGCGLLAVLAATWYFKRKGHGHAHQKQSGMTSFDVFADQNAIHMLQLENGPPQALRYRRIEPGKPEFESLLPVKSGETIVSRRSNDVQVAASGKHLFAVWQIAGTGYGNRGPMRLAESSDAGKTWFRVAGPAAPQRTDDQGFVALLGDAGEVFHLVWLDVAGGGKGLRYAAFREGVWEKMQSIAPVTCQCCWNSLAQNPDGSLLVLYRGASPRDMMLGTFSHGQWQGAERVDPVGWQINICPHAGGGISARSVAYTYAVTWTGKEDAIGIYFNRRDNVSGAWDHRAKIGSATARNPDVAESADSIAVVWDEYAGEARVVKAVLSRDRGKTWTSEKILSPAGVHASYPRVLPLNAGFKIYWSESVHNNLSIGSTHI